MRIRNRQIGPGRIPVIRRLPTAMGKPEHDAVLFEGWYGRYGDSPRAISEELARRDAPFRRIWVVGPESADIPPGVHVVQRESWAHLYWLTHAGYVVACNYLPSYFKKRSGQIYLQTWHGTPLKKIGFDIEAIDGSDRKRRKNLEREVASWDYLIAQSAWAGNVLATAFQYEGEVLDSGYPRTDRLVGTEAAAERTRIRSELNLPRDAKVVLYCPTWRDSTSFSLQLDFARLSEGLDDRYLFLFRAHQIVTVTEGPLDHARVRDVSSYSDVNDLLLAADVLITDYSSVMFDFAVTRKPIIFFAYDLSQYRDQLRGVYFDLEALAPGPIASTTDEVEKALASLDVGSDPYASAYDEFVATFCPTDDGSAAARVVDSVFA
jgi:CDP-glycerol glycerophosphotransferase